MALLLALAILLLLDGDAAGSGAVAAVAAVPTRSPAIARRRPSRLSVLLLSCGVVAPLIYVATDILLALRWHGYSYGDQTISELNAIGAPTRTLSVVLGITGYACLASFGIGVLRSAGTNRRLRVAAGALISLGVLGCFGVPFMSMHVRGAERTLTDTLHVAQLGIAGPLILVILGFGAAAFGRRFRVYSAVTAVVMLGFGAWTGTYGTAVADNLATPWVGVIERVSVFSYQLWFVVFALALLGRGIRSAWTPAARVAAGDLPRRVVVTGR